MGEGGRKKERMRGEKWISLKFVSHIGMYYLMSLNFSEQKLYNNDEWEAS